MIFNIMHEILAKMTLLFEHNTQFESFSLFLYRAGHKVRHGREQHRSSPQSFLLRCRGLAGARLGGADRRSTAEPLEDVCSFCSGLFCNPSLKSVLPQIVKFLVFVFDNLCAL